MDTQLRFTGIVLFSHSLWQTDDNFLTVAKSKLRNKEEVLLYSSKIHHGTSIFGGEI